MSIEQGSTEAATSTLSFGEIVWAVKKYRGVKEAIAAGEAFVNMFGLALIPVDESVIRFSLDLMKKYFFDPRDSIHAASAILCRAEAMISTDSHFDKFEELPRKPIYSSWHACHCLVLHGDAEEYISKPGMIVDQEAGPKSV